MDHFLHMSGTAIGAHLPAPHQADAAPASSYLKLDAGKAVTLRAKQLSVLRITHGRVWATLSDAGRYSRVLAGDHFLSRGQSLTLLPGQELVMESFEPSTSSHTATAHFSWQTPGVAASPLQDTWSANRANSRGVMQPLRDLRHAMGLAAGATSRLAQGLVHGAATAPLTLLNAFAMLFVAKCAGTACPNRSFSNTKKHDSAQAASCSAR